MYQQIASAYPNSYAAPLAMLSQVYILKSQNRNDDARRICETMLTQYRTSFWAGEAMQQLRLLKPVTTSTPPPAAAVAPMAPPMLAAPAAPAPQAPPAPNRKRRRQFKSSGCFSQFQGRAQFRRPTLIGERALAFSSS